MTTTDALFLHLDDDACADPATRETLRYRTALRVGFERTVERGLTKATASAVCSTIKGLEMDLRALPGTRISSPVTGEITYSPPEGRELIAEKVSEWEHFIHADDGMDPLVRMAAAHYQFEAIHPFADGNGRTGRISHVLMLVKAGLLRQPLLYLSRYIFGTESMSGRWVMRSGRPARPPTRIWPAPHVPARADATTQHAGAVPCLIAALLVTTG